MTTLNDRHIAWLGKFAERVTKRNSQLRFKPENAEEWAGVASSVVEGMFTAPLEAPPKGLPEQSALDAEIERVVSEMALNAPDVESGDESEADVKAYWLNLFERYAAAKLTDMTAQRDAACAARDAAVKAHREAIAAAEQVTRQMKVERDAAVRNCAITQSRYDALRLRFESNPLTTDVHLALVYLEENTQAELQDLLWDRNDLLMAHRVAGGRSGCDYGKMARDEIRKTIAEIRDLRARIAKPTLQELEHGAVEIRDAALKRIRDDFQKRAPHYTPPPGAGWVTWSSWMDANVVRHTKAGFKARFPYLDQILTDNYMASAEETAAAFEARVYRRKS